MLLFILFSQTGNSQLTLALTAVFAQNANAYDIFRFSRRGDYQSPAPRSCAKGSHRLDAIIELADNSSSQPRYIGAGINHRKSVFITWHIFSPGSGDW